MSRSSTLFALLAIALTVASAASPSDYIITNLPGVNFTLPFTLYGGYVPVAFKGFTAQMFFMFAESQNDPTTDPVILWLNGGPGCSSLGGMFEENGPLYPVNNKELASNPYSWNLVANMLWLESPPGVGFSKHPGSITWTDTDTAELNYMFLQNWFAIFSDFLPNKFYITGESYAGHYIPTLVNQIYINKGKGIGDFRGYMVGNPSTHSLEDDDDGGSLEYYYQTHAMIPLNSKSGSPPSNLINPYDILVDVCHAAKLRRYVRFPTAWNNWNPNYDSKTELHTPLNQQGDEHNLHARYVPNTNPCEDNFLQAYLNEPSVQSAIHAQPTHWSDCSGINYQFGGTMIPYYITFMNNTDWNITVYSGDADTVLNFIGTERWIMQLGRPVVSPWTYWTYNRIGESTQLAGFMIEYDRITFRTVKGAGHMVPEWQPAPALQMLKEYLANGR